ncbi:hypothetical protein CGRA01v4_01943 [Colletotrichum graminicola]|uniref:Uncharacterized protein n=1 Tax=Colletotrichum graminicola (strain M1.001 / M2 / FGSC 10212) TaxID=645133 RepID=E3QJS2_COLGM|nr:uncharacterized protein GLRG_06254 [Colletotrichum graminicola M1.001]EFQ31110.1 hypothetical protein GLRG_06254 [Colletotrichum graminicola M1.001]WDK10664.1 hypothetical protein CGRA01v4_01943 [Colletotrichum graminicola]
MVKACPPRLLLLNLFFCFSLAATANEEKGRWVGLADGGDSRLPVEHQRRRAGFEELVDILGGRAQPPTASTDISKPVALEKRVVLAVPTPPALFGGSVLKGRQDPNDAIASASRSAQQAIASASQSAQQAVQQAGDQVRQAQDQVRQAQDQARQASDAASRTSSSASSAVSQAQSSARQAISDAQNSARQSASQQISQNLASVTSSASMQIASIRSSASASAASAIAAATQSALAMVQSARTDADSRVQQAQGTAVSVTQAAVIIVGAIIGSSLLTILCFYLFTRYRRSKRKDHTARGSRRGNSYPAQDSPMAARGLVMDTGYPQDVKRPMSPARPETALTTGPGGMGYAVTNFGDSALNFSRTTTFMGSTAPQTGGIGVLSREPSVTRKPIPPPLKKPAAFNLFPSTPKEGSFGVGGLPSNPSSMRDRGWSVSSSASTAVPTLAPTGPANEKLDRVDEETDDFGEGGRRWLRRTRTVSPFGDLAESPTKGKGANWPFTGPGSPATAR